MTTVDNTGKILARSPSIPFVKTAQAAGFSDEIETLGADDSSFFSLPILLVAVAVFVIFILGAITLAGSAASGVKGRDDDSDGDAGMGNGAAGAARSDANDGVTITERDGDIPPTPGR